MPGWCRPGTPLTGIDESEAIRRTVLRCPRTATLDIYSEGSNQALDSGPWFYSPPIRVMLHLFEPFH